MLRSAPFDACYTFIDEQSRSAVACVCASTPYLLSSRTTITVRTLFISCRPTPETRFSYSFWFCFILGFFSFQADFLQIRLFSAPPAARRVSNRFAQHSSLRRFLLCRCSRPAETAQSSLPYSGAFLLLLNFFKFASLSG